MSDIHGQYDRFQNLLHQLNLQKEDKLYILGDVVDRGPHPMKILQYMMKHQNIIPIIGNHEVMALPNLKLLVPEISKDFLQGLSPEEYQNFAQWTLTGGTTADHGIHRIVSSIWKGNDKQPGILAGTRRA